MKIHILAIAGKAGSGKSTLKDMYVEEIGRLGGQSLSAKFAGPLKQVVNILMNWDERHSEGALKEVIDPFWGFSPRHAYQTLGTEWAQVHLRKDFWVKHLEMRLEGAIKVLKEGNEGDGDFVFILDDLRFKHEFDWLDELKKSIWINERFGDCDDRSELAKQLSTVQVVHIVRPDAKSPILSDEGKKHASEADMMQFLAPWHGLCMNDKGLDEVRDFVVESLDWVLGR